VGWASPIAGGLMLNVQAVERTWADAARLDYFSQQSANFTALARRENAALPPQDARSAASGVEAAGLVPYKTSDHGSEFLIPTDPQTLAENRIRRLRKNVWAAGKLMSQAAKKSDRCWLVTLTYRAADAWAPRHLSEAVKRFRHWCSKRAIKPRYVWCAEIQTKRAETSGDMVLHYHLAVWLPSGVSCPMWDKGGRNYAPFWPHGMTNRALAKNAVGYLMKYMSKIGKYHEFPKGARIHGSGGLETADKLHKQWLNLPTWAKQLVGVGETVVREGSRLVLSTGRALCSPYRVVRERGRLLMRTVSAVPETWVSGAWSRLGDWSSMEVSPA
jgi:hypothetical protein